MNEQFICAQLWADNNEMEFETCSEFPIGCSPAHDFFSTEYQRMLGQVLKTDKILIKTCTGFADGMPSILFRNFKCKTDSSKILVR